jgi:hypothetical protein
MLLKVDGATGISIRTSLTRPEFFSFDSPRSTHAWTATSGLLG